MRSSTIAIFLVFALASFTFAAQTSTSLESLLQMRAQASGAVETVLRLLEDLRRASLNEMEDLEKRNRTQEDEGVKLISELTSILNNNQKNYDAAIEHRKFIEKEIEDTEGHILWIENRLAEIARKVVELKSQRCHANALFVDALKEHNDALKAIQTLKDDIAARHAAGELTEIGSLTEKFKTYEHLFEKETINSFLELANGGQKPLVTEDNLEADNKRDALKLEGMTTNPGQRNLKGNLAEVVLQLLTNLINHLKASMKDLEKHEIQAAYDYADFKSSSAIENVTLREDLNRKHKYLVKLEIDVEVARESEDRCLVLRDEAQISVDSAVTDLEAKRAKYAQDEARIREDLSTIDHVIEIFKEKVASMQQYLSARIDEHQEGDPMTHNMERQTDKFDSKYVKVSGKKASN